MTGEQNLAVLLATMEPVLWDMPFGFALLPADQPPPEASFALIHEPEALTVIAPRASLVASGLPAGDDWARISLTVHSALTAVGLTAAVAAALAAEGISANVVAGSFHDHVLVPWDRREEALAALLRLTGRGA